MTAVVQNQKKFDYNYYLSKNCPLIENWKLHKKRMLKEAAIGGNSRQTVFKELFESESNHSDVGNFLTEFIANVFPPSFLSGKNKQIFNKKVH